MVREEAKKTAASRRAVAVPSLRKAVLILDLIGRRGRLTFSTIQKTLDLPKSTTHQLLKALTDISAVEIQTDGRFVLGPKTCELGVLGIRQRTIDNLSLKHLESLAVQSGLPSEIATFEGRNAVVLASESMENARDFTKFLQSSTAQEILSTYGFQKPSTAKP